MKTWNPNEEGTTHINAYSKSRTKLGKALSNFAYTPFTCVHGAFTSLEGYWYWLSCPPSEGKDELRHLYGYQAKQRGRELRALNWPQDPEFKDWIRAAITAKIQQNDWIERLLVANSLPIVHYYNYAGNIHVPTEGQWIWDHATALREQLKHDHKIVIMVTGHRPQKLGGYEPNPLQTWVKATLYQVLKEAKNLYPEVEVISGMAQGVDQWWAQAAVNLHIPFHAFIPFLGQAAQWPQARQQEYETLLRQAASSVIVCRGSYHSQKMQIRNERMVDEATTCVSVWNTVAVGGTWNCIEYIAQVDKPHYQLNTRARTRLWIRSPGDIEP